MQNALDFLKEQGCSQLKNDFSKNVLYNYIKTIITRMNVNSFHDRKYVTPCQAQHKKWSSITKYCKALLTIAKNCQALTKT